MKKILGCLVLAAALAGGMAPAAAAAADVSIYINEQKLVTEAAPEMRENTTFVPVRVVSEQLGCKVDYADKEIMIRNFDAAGTEIRLTVGSKESARLEPAHLEGNVNDPEIQAYLALPENAELAALVKNSGSEGFGIDYQREVPQQLAAAPYVKNGVTYVPLRFVSEQLGCGVDYAGGEIRITKQSSLTLEGQNVASLVIDLDGWSSREKTDHKNIVAMVIDLIEKSGKQAAALTPEDRQALAKYDFEYSFLDGQDKEVSTWQFYLPANEVGQDIWGQWSKMYLYESVSDVWYSVQVSAYAQYADLMSPYFGAKFYDFESVPK